MKLKTLFGVALFAALTYSCKNENKDAPSVEDPKLVKENAVKDSIAEAEQAEIVTAKQDSAEASKIKAYAVKRISGKHTYPDDKTTVEYTSLYHELKNVREIAAKEMWTDEKLNQTISEYKNFAKGGIVTLNVERLTIASANNEMFTVIIKDANDNEIYRKDLESDIPEYSSRKDIWWNIGSVFIPNRVKAPFYIYFVDKMEKGPFKYEVTAVK